MTWSQETAMNQPTFPHNAHKENVTGIRHRDSSTVLAWLLALNLGIATLTLWVQPYWPVALFEINMFVLAAAALLCRKRPRPDTYFPLFALGFIIFWGCIQFATGWSVVRFETMNAIWKWTSWLAVYYVASSIFSNLHLSERFRVGMAWFGLAVAGEAIMQAFLSPNKIFGLFPAAYQGYVMGPILYHTHFAVFIETILPISLFLAFSDEKKSYTFLGISAVLLTSVIVSASRGGLIIIFSEIIAILVLLWLQKTANSRKIGTLVLSLASLVVVLMLVVGLGTISERFYTGTFVRGRLQFALSSLQMIEARPWTGFGLGCWPSVYPAFASFDPGVFVNQAHCDWLQWIAEGGLEIGIAMLSLTIWALRRIVLSVWGIGVIAVLVHATFDYPFSRPAVGAWPFLVLAMAATSASTAKPSHDSSSGLLI